MPRRAKNPSPAVPNSELAFLINAVAFAAHKHRDQRRKDAKASPYINHPIAVAHVLATVGNVRDPVTLAAAILHDTLEDTKTTPQELKKHFGQDVLLVVQELTDDKSLPKATRKRLQVEHASSLSRRARLVKYGDKICNVLDIIERPPKHWRKTRRLKALAWMKDVIDQCRGANAPLERYFDRTRVRAMRKLCR
jgi:guanosine-3',5'-bis(diphosphate) 3'-pyrophosphohydrolase